MRNLDSGTVESLATTFSDILAFKNENPLIIINIPKRNTPNLFTNPFRLMAILTQ